MVSLPIHLQPHSDSWPPWPRLCRCAVIRAPPGSGSKARIYQGDKCGRGCGHRLRGRDLRHASIGANFSRSFAPCVARRSASGGASLAGMPGPTLHGLHGLGQCSGTLTLSRGAGERKVSVPGAERAARNVYRAVRGDGSCLDHFHRTLLLNSTSSTLPIQHAFFRFVCSCSRRDGAAHPRPRGPNGK